jgi:hypothetical protein
MAYQRIPGFGMAMPSVEHHVFLGVPVLTTAGLLIDASTEKIAYVGRVFFHARSGTKDIERVGFRFGSVTKAGGSGLTVSLQDVSTTSGPPYTPDEVQDQTVAIANGDATFASNTWHRTGTLSANRTVSNGDWLAVVVEFDGSGRLGADAVNLSALSFETGGSPFSFSAAGAVWKTGGAWAATTNGVGSMAPNLVLEFSDGSFGTLWHAVPLSLLSAVTYSSSSSPDEYALEFSLPFPCKVDGAWVVGTIAGNAEVVLYDGTTVMEAIVIDANRLMSNSVRRWSNNFTGEHTLAANTTYRLSLKPTTTTSVLLNYIDVADANHFAALDGGTAMCLTGRVNEGSWDAPTTTRRPLMGLYLSSFDDGVGGGGGAPYHGAMSGGML